MSYEEQEQQDGTEGTDGNEGVDDLTMSLHGGGAGEANFVSESKNPVSKGTMVVAGLLIACAGVTYFMYVRNGPTAAVASDPNADQTINSFLQGGSSKTKEWQDLIKSTDKVVQQFKREIPQVPLASLANNPFQKGRSKPSVDQAAMDKERRKAYLSGKIKEAFNDLKLQTIIHPNPKRATCMINNALYRKGQKVTVGAEEKVVFTVDDIRPDGVSVSSMAVDEAIKFELKMKQ
jgi:hypothetical protein